MSDEITDQLPADDGRNTTPMLRQILGEVREFRHETGERLGGVEREMAELKTEVAGIKAEVAEIKTDLAEFKAETRQALRDLDRTLASSQRDTLRRYVDIEERVDKLEGERRG